jgi:hypothetical protein
MCRTVYMELRVDRSVGKIVRFENIIDFLVEIFVTARECGGVVYRVVIALCVCVCVFWIVGFSFLFFNFFCDYGSV